MGGKVKEEAGATVSAVEARLSRVKAQAEALIRQGKAEQAVQLLQSTLRQEASHEASPASPAYLLLEAWLAVASACAAAAKKGHCPKCCTPLVHARHTGHAPHGAASFINWYQVLQVEVGCSEAAIKKKFKEKALLLHPDKNRFPHADEAFRLVSEAQKVLLDSAKRADFDGFLVRVVASCRTCSPFPGAGGAAPGRQRHSHALQNNRPHFFQSFHGRTGSSSMHPPPSMGHSGSWDAQFQDPQPLQRNHRSQHTSLNRPGLRSNFKAPPAMPAKQRRQQGPARPVTAPSGERATSAPAPPPLSPRAQEDAAEAIPEESSFAECKDTLGDDDGPASQEVGAQPGVERGTEDNNQPGGESLGGGKGGERGTSVSDQGSSSPTPVEVGLARAELRGGGEYGLGEDWGRTRNVPGTVWGWESMDDTVQLQLAKEAAAAAAAAREVQGEGHELLASGAGPMFPRHRHRTVSASAVTTSGSQFSLASYKEHLQQVRMRAAENVTRLEKQWGEKKEQWRQELAKAKDPAGSPQLGPAGVASPPQPGLVGAASRPLLGPAGLASAVLPVPPDPLTLRRPLTAAPRAMLRVTSDLGGDILGRVPPDLTEESAGQGSGGGGSGEAAQKAGAGVGGSMTYDPLSIWKNRKGASLAHLAPIMSNDSDTAAEGVKAAVADSSRTEDANGAQSTVMSSANRAGNGSTTIASGSLAGEGSAALEANRQPSGAPKSAHTEDAQATPSLGVSTGPAVTSEPASSEDSPGVQDKAGTRSKEDERSGAADAQDIVGAGKVDAGAPGAVAAGSGVQRETGQGPEAAGATPSEPRAEGQDPAAAPASAPPAPRPWLPWGVFGWGLKSSRQKFFSRSPVKAAGAQAEARPSQDSSERSSGPEAEPHSSAARGSDGQVQELAGGAAAAVGTGVAAGVSPSPAMAAGGPGAGEGSSQAARDANPAESEGTGREAVGEMPQSSASAVGPQGAEVFFTPTKEPQATDSEAANTLSLLRSSAPASQPEGGNQGGRGGLAKETASAGTPFRRGSKPQTPRSQRPKQLYYQQQQQWRSNKGLTLAQLRSEINAAARAAVSSSPAGAPPPRGLSPSGDQDGNAEAQGLSEVRRSIAADLDASATPLVEAGEEGGSVEKQVGVVAGSKDGETISGNQGLGKEQGGGIPGPSEGSRMSGSIVANRSRNNSNDTSNSAFASCHSGSTTNSAVAEGAAASGEPLGKTVSGASAPDADSEATSRLAGGDTTPVSSPLQKSRRKRSPNVPQGITISPGTVARARAGLIAGSSMNGGPSPAALGRASLEAGERYGLGRVNTFSSSSGVPESTLAAAAAALEKAKLALNKANSSTGVPVA